jgi:hypothetical protein
MVGVVTALMGNATEADGLPPLFTTVTLALPTVAISAADTDAVNCVEPTNAVARAVPFHCTTALLRKFVPFTVSVKAGPPAPVAAGFRLMMVGVGTVMGKLVDADGLPPVFVTVMPALPPLAIRLAGTEAVNCVALTNVVVSPVPFQFTTAPLRKLVPFTVSVNAGPPAGVVAGLRLVIVGVGMVIEKLVDVDVLPPEFATVTLALPPLAIRLAATVAVTCVLLTNVVASAVPFHCTVAPDRKPVPLTVRVKPDPPAFAEAGLRLLMVGVGMLMGNVVTVDALPPLFVTAILALPGLVIRLAGTAAVTWVALTNVVVSAVEFQLTVAPDRKFVPLTVSVNAGPLAPAEAGLRLVIVGVGTPIVNVAAVDAVPPAFAAVMLAVPGAVIKLAGADAVS